MRIFKTVTKEVKQVAGVSCDKCGRSCIGKIGNFCGIQFEVCGGYDSPVFPDNETVRKYDICEYCAIEWMKTWAKNLFLTSTNQEKTLVKTTPERV